MSPRLLALLLVPLAAGCAGNVADYIGPRAGIVSPQLIRFGFDLRETRCVGEWLGGALTPLQLRRLVRTASTVRRGSLDPDRLTPQDMIHVAASTNDAAVADAMVLAIQGCRMSPDRIAGGIVAALAPAPEPAPAEPAALRPAWLNLGAAGSGQSIAVDASTLEQDASTRTAWFRLTNPGATAPGPDAFLLRIDCAARTINAKARRRRDAAGAIAEHVDYPDNPLPVEGGTVMEIAYLALCT